MKATKDKVIHLHRRDPQEALARLNRITGLHFAHWPESLAPLPAPDAAEERDGDGDSPVSAQR
ncbi:MAG: hypothetical protein ACRERY_04130 [Pseudomonas sp.]